MTSLLFRRRINSWAQDAAEHAIRAAASAALASAPIANGARIESFVEWEPWSVGLAAGVISLLMSIAGRKRGNPSTASLRSKSNKDAT